MVRATKTVVYHGKTRLFAELCREFKQNDSTVLYRLRKGWTVEKAFETPGRGGSASDPQQVRSEGDAVEARQRSTGSAQFAAGFAAGAAAFLAAALERAAAADRFPQVLLSRQGVEQVLRMVDIEALVARQFGGGA